jgi:hypothetical protein
VEQNEGKKADAEPTETIKDKLSAMVQHSFGVIWQHGICSKEETQCGRKNA